MFQLGNQKKSSFIYEVFVKKARLFHCICNIIQKIYTIN